MPSQYAGDPSNFPAAVQIPVNTDGTDAVTPAVPLEGIADRTAGLAADMHPVAFASAGVDDPSSAHAQQGSNVTSTSYVNTTIVVALSDLRAGDRVKLTGTVWAKLTVPAGPPVNHRAILRLVAGTIATVNNAIPEITWDDADVITRTFARLLTLDGFFVVPNAAPPSITFTLQGKVTVAGDTLALCAPVALTALVYRSN